MVCPSSFDLRRSSAASAIMESFVYTAPVGLFGVLMMTMRVLGLMASSIASMSSWKVSGSVGTSTTLQCHACTHMRYSA